jgi:hypothetical protein
MLRYQSTAMPQLDRSQIRAGMFVAGAEYPASRKAGPGRGDFLIAGYHPVQIAKSVEEKSATLAMKPGLYALPGSEAALAIRLDAIRRRLKDLAALPVPPGVGLAARRDLERLTRDRGLKPDGRPPLPLVKSCAGPQLVKGRASRVAIDSVNTMVMPEALYWDPDPRFRTSMTLFSRSTFRMAIQMGTPMRAISPRRGPRARRNSGIRGGLSPAEESRDAVRTSQADTPPHASAPQGSKRSQRRISPRGYCPKSETTRSLKADQYASGNAGRITARHAGPRAAQRGPSDPSRNTASFPSDKILDRFFNGSHIAQAQRGYL